ncbi:hypothetical protein Q0Z83_046070 [Actinoplanes sichuanensis]|uniref:Uncharacterized protein n=1 Tax=Actinoplanes sichuanensis TaxID=512349 RepID=A0ABW4A9I5_9ACTN|nr:hypothetical protein [Actinoplanes sichuanensis]BEL06416.1 hypothetical protein Q0Z83_046070 [Actinoplanes sichuanensis]
MKFYTTVFLAPVGPELVVPALTAALAPFDYNDYAHEPFDVDAAWDWWQLPQQSLLPLRPEYADDPSALRVGDGVVVAAPKRIIDFAAMRRSARDHAAGTWDAWADVVRAHPGALPRARFDEIHDDPESAQRAWLQQPAVQEFAQAAASQDHPYFTFSLLTADPVVVFAGDRGHFLARAAAQAIATHAYLTSDGRWFTEYTDDRGWDTHILEMDGHLDSVPDDAVIARVRCHI